MKSGQATGCLISIPIILFSIGMIVFKVHLSWWVWVILILILSQTLGLAFHGNEDEYQNEPPWKDEQAHLEDVIVTKIDNHTVQVESHGRKFLLWKDRQDKPWFQEISPRGKLFGNKITAAENSWRFGKSEDKALAEHIKRKINNGTR